MNNNDLERNIKAYQCYIFNMAYKLTLDVQLAEDLSQETFLRFFEKADQISGPEKIQFWLRKICINIFLMRKRKEAGIKLISIHDDSFSPELEKQLVDDAPSSLDEVIVAEHVREIQNGCFLAMTRFLTLEQRVVFSLYDMFGVSLSEIADIIGVSDGAAKGLLHRGRKNIFNFFSDHCEWIDPANSCRCESWKRFVSDKQALKEEVKKIEKNNSFKEIPDEKNIPSAKKHKILYLYHNLPGNKPGADWYKKVVSAVKN